MRKTFLSIMAAVLTAITLITILPYTSGKVEAATTYKYTSQGGGVPFVGSYLGNHVEYDNRYQYYYPENYSGSDLDVYFMFTGRSKFSSITEIENEDNTKTEEYLSKWVNNYGIKPFVLIVIKVHECCADGAIGKMNEYDYYHYVAEGPFEQLVGLVKNGHFSKAGARSNLYISGYSMGASAALFTATIHGSTYNFQGVGAFSPSMHFLSSNCNTAFYYNGWQNIPYPDLKYWFYSYGSLEDTPFKEHAEQYYQDICLTKSGVNATLSKIEYYDPTNKNDQHNWRLFRRELFTFIYSVNHDYKCPDINTINSANDINALVWSESTNEGDNYWTNHAIQEGNKVPENISEVQESYANTPTPEIYIVHYYVNGTEVCEARVQEGCPIPKYPSGLSGEYIWYYSKDTKAKQVDHSKGVYKDYNVNGTKIK